MRKQRITPLLLASLLALPVTAATGRSQPDSVLTLWQQESYLLNQRVPLNNLELWDTGDHRWRSPRSGELPGGRARVLVLHLWADWCGPCVQELPRLRELAQRLTMDYGGEVAMVFVSETHVSEKMEAFLRANPEALKDIPLYHDSNGRLADNLAQALPQSAVTLPATLLLDRDLVVRQALVGPQLARRGELVNGVARLLRLLKGSPDAPRR